MKDDFINSLIKAKNMIENQGLPEEHHIIISGKTLNDLNPDVGFDVNKTYKIINGVITELE